MNRFKLGIVLETLGLPVRKALPESARLGISGVQIDAAGELHPKHLTESGRREIRALLRGFNLEISALNCPLRKGLDVAEDLQPRLDYLRDAMQLAFDLGAKKVIAPMPSITGFGVKTSGPPPLPTPVIFIPGMSPPTQPATAAATTRESPREATTREALTALASAGDKTGSVIALETGLDAGETVRDYLNTFDAGTLTVNFDPVNFLLNGHDPIASAAALEGKISHTHARDAKRSLSSGPREVPVGTGDLDWLLYIATLESIEYRGFLIVDRELGESKADDVAFGVGFLRRFVSPLDQ